MRWPHVYAEGLRILVQRAPMGGQRCEPGLLAIAGDPAQAQAIAHAADLHCVLVLALMDARDALKLEALPQSALALTKVQAALAMVAGTSDAAPPDHEVAV